MKPFIAALIISTLSSMLCSCNDNNDNEPAPAKPTVERTIAVVLPMENGLDAHWKRIFTLLDHNIEMAFAAQNCRVKLNIEYHDETTQDLDKLAKTLATRTDIYAVVGGLYSDNATTLASSLCNTGVTLLTPATTEELVRGFASTGNLWALTETDITQSEVLLSKVVNYGGKSVALIANDSDPYGKTFIDWFGFQAKELGLKVTGVHNYANTTLNNAAAQAATGGADYVICAPSHIADIATVIDTFNATPHAPRLLFSDMGYGSDVIDQLGPKAEGIEGVCFGANPESGFDVSYRTFFGVDPTVGAAQLYDAGMLLAYAIWYQEVNPDATLRDALRAIVDGRDFNMGSWMGEDMRNVVTALAKGHAPYVRGASGWLDFDSKVYTNVLSTIYYNYKVYDGKYIILDYNTADGGNRTDATLAGWNWKATQKQEFDSNDTTASYGPITAHRALLVAASTGWANYRHQADVLAMYQLLKEHGYTDSDIILILADDIATNPANPTPGVISISPSGDNLYHDINIDYRLGQLTPDDLCNIISGTATSRTPVVLDGNQGTNLLLFWSGHGTPGALCWDDITMGITGPQLRQALQKQERRNGYRKLAMFVETCYSGSVLEQCTGLPGTIFYTAAAPDETSKADIFNTNLGIWMSNRFTSTLLESLTNKSVISMHELYNRLFINTVGSHVTVYNADNYGNLYNSSMDEFINP